MGTQRRALRLCYVLRLVLLVCALLMIVVATPAKAFAAELRVHVLPYEMQDAIVLEVRDETGVHFAMVDAGEDSDMPDGSDARYPVRAGTSSASLGREGQTIAYLSSLGVNADNFEAFIGTHAHSDHIGAADEVIYAFCPQRVYTPEYKDAYITNSSRLWDNLYVYDHLIAAAEATGASLITSLSYDAPLVPVAGSSEGNAVFKLGAAKVEICNWLTNYRAGVNDFNYASWVVLVSLGNSKVLLLGDLIEENPRYYTILARVGHVDVAKLSHHGLINANSPSHLELMSPSYAIQTGPYSRMAASSVDALVSMGSHHYVSSEAVSAGLSAIVITLDESGVSSTNYPTSMQFRYRSADGKLRAYADGLAVNYTGTVAYEGTNYSFTNSRVSGSGSSDKWVKSKGRWWYRYADGSYPTNTIVNISGKYYGFDKYGWMVTGWHKFSGKWYWFASSGAMATNKWIQGKYYVGSDGAMLTSTWTPDGYYVNANGVWVKGKTKSSAQTSTNKTSNSSTSTSSKKSGSWVKSKGRWWYRYSDGSYPASKLVKINGVVYGFDKYGWMVTGWHKFSGKWYWFASSGAMATNKWIQGKYYVGSDGAMLTSTWTPDGYYVNANGAWVKSKGKR